MTKNYCEISSKYSWICDYNEVLSAEKEVRSLEDAAKLEKVLLSLEGDLLEGQFFENCEILSEFIMVQRYNLEQKKNQILKLLVQYYTQNKLWNDCLRLLEKGENLDPYDEEAAVLRTRILLQEGYNQEAEKFYRRFCTRLFRDIGEGPGPELKNIGKSLRLDKTEVVKQNRIKVRGIKSIEYYGIAAMLDGFLQIPQFDVFKYLEPSEKEELAYIQRKFGKLPSLAPSGPRIVDCCLNCIERIAQSEKRIIIEVLIDTMDNSSKGVFIELHHRYINEKTGLQIRLVK